MILAIAALHGILLTGWWRFCDQAWPVALAFSTTVSLWIFLEGHTQRSIEQSRSGSVDWYSIVFGISLATLIAFCPLGQTPTLGHTSAGLGLMSVGFTLRLLAINRLQHRFQNHIGGHVDRQLETQGIYRLCRHPSEVGNFLFVLGAALFSFPLIIVLFVAAIFALQIGIRIRREEAVLADKFGLDFVRYAQTTPAFIPGPIGKFD